MDPIQSNADVKRGSLLRTGNPRNNENKPRFASAPVLDRICGSPWDLNGSDPNSFGYFIQSR